MKIKRFLILVSFVIQQALTPGWGYCFYHQSGSDISSVAVYIYNNVDDIKSIVRHKQGQFNLPVTFSNVGGSKFLSWNYKALHKLEPGEHACWHWKDTGFDKMYFTVVVETEDKRTIPSTNHLRVYADEFNTHDGLCYCNKSGLEKVIRNAGDPRCGDKP